MNNSIRTVLLACVSVAATSGFIADACAERVTFVNGKIYTPTGWADALAIDGGAIVAVGRRADVEKQSASDAKIVDLQGDTVFPGLHDMHLHAVDVGVKQQECRFLPELTLEQVQKVVKDCVSRIKPGEWIRGGQFSVASLGSAPTREALDRVAPNNPVVLMDINSFDSWANTQALRRAGITRDTPDPADGTIVKDAQGEPTGYLKMAAQQMIYKIIPEASFDQQIEGLAWAAKYSLSHGVTSFVEPMANEEKMRAYALLSDRKTLKQRVKVCVHWALGQEKTEQALAHRNLYRRDRIQPDCVKIFLDGVPTTTRTAVMLRAYETSQDHPQPTSGVFSIQPKELESALVRFDRMGLRVMTHSVGDGSVRANVNAIEAARVSNGWSHVIHQVGHATVVDLDDLSRASALGAAFEFSPWIWYPNPLTDDIRRAIGNARMERYYPVRDALSRRAIVSAGSDRIMPDALNPWNLIETLVTREALGGSNETAAFRERISLDAAIDIFTVNAARLTGMRHLVGAIEPGMRADFIITDRNPFDGSPHDIHKTQVQASFIDGEPAYVAEGWRRLGN